MENKMKVLYEKRDRVAYITINRPEAHNALDFETGDKLADAFSAFRDDDELWIAVLTGAGDQSFQGSLAHGRRHRRPKGFYGKKEAPF
jgi:enoyl-CoA hydratase/carnithine racemase